MWHGDLIYVKKHNFSKSQNVYGKFGIGTCFYMFFFTGRPGGRAGIPGIPGYTGYTGYPAGRAGGYTGYTRVYRVYCAVAL